MVDWRCSCCVETCKGIICNEPNQVSLGIYASIRKAFCKTEEENMDDAPVVSFNISRSDVIINKIYAVHRLVGWETVGGISNSATHIFTCRYFVVSMLKIILMVAVPDLRWMLVYFSSSVAFIASQ